MNENSLVICFGGPTVNKTALCHTPRATKTKAPAFGNKRSRREDQ